VTGPPFRWSMHHRRQQGAIRITSTAHSHVRLADLRNTEASQRICHNPLLAKRAPPSQTLWSAALCVQTTRLWRSRRTSSPAATQPTRPAAGENKLSAPQPAGAGCISAPPVVHSGLRWDQPCSSHIAGYSHAEAKGVSRRKRSELSKAPLEEIARTPSQLAPLSDNEAESEDRSVR
jgi:hypothetical protein